MAEKSPALDAKATSKGPSNDGNGKAIKNELLLALPQRMQLTAFQADARKPKIHNVMQEAGESIKFSYFPNTAMASILPQSIDCTRLLSSTSGVPNTHVFCHVSCVLAQGV